MAENKKPRLNEDGDEIILCLACGGEATESQDEKRVETKERVPLHLRQSVTESQFAQLNGVGSDRVREWILDPTFPAFRDSSEKGARTVIPVEPALEWLAKRAKNRDNMPKTMKSYFR